MPHQIKTMLHREGWPLTVSCGLVYLGFGIQLLGICLAEGLLPLLRSGPSLLWRYVGEFDFNLTTISPLLALFALYVLRTPSAYEEVPGKRKFAWRIVITTLIVSALEFWWSWSGHPGWLRGFVG